MGEEDRKRMLGTLRQVRPVRGCRPVVGALFVRLEICFTLIMGLLSDPRRTRPGLSDPTRVGTPGFINRE